MEHFFKKQFFFSCNQFLFCIIDGVSLCYIGEIPNLPTYLRDYQDVFVTACGTSFYSQCLPRKSVHLAFSATAIHWRSTVSVTLSLQILITLPNFCVSIASHGSNIRISLANSFCLYLTAYFFNLVCVHKQVPLSVNHRIIYYRDSLTDAIVHLISSNKQEVQVFAKQFKKDWETFLLMRAKELVPGKCSYAVQPVLTSTIDALVQNC